MHNFHLISIKEAATLDFKVKVDRIPLILSVIREAREK